MSGFHNQWRYIAWTRSGGRWRSFLFRVAERLERSGFKSLAQRVDAICGLRS